MNVNINAGRYKTSLSFAFIRRWLEPDALPYRVAVKLEGCAC
jgi:hypothetical protein